MKNLDTVAHLPVSLNHPALDKAIKGKLKIGYLTYCAINKNYHSFHLLNVGRIVVRPTKTSI